jgi:DNA-binding NtrC family response regulator
MQLPPLRERPREMALLAERFAAETAKLAGLGAVSFDAAALHAMASYRWPGNIRELRNVVSRSVVGSGGGVIELGHLPPQFAATAGGDATRRTAVPRADVTEVVRRVPLDEELRDLERARILSALEASDGNQTRAAELLGLPRRTLVSRIAALGIRSGRARGSSERS